MAQVRTYLNFMGNTEEAFNFYKTVFGTEFTSAITYMGDMPADPNQPELSEEDKRKVMNIALPISGGHELMGTDLLESLGQKLELGNNVSIHIQLDTKEEVERLFNALSEGGKIDMPLQEMFWGDYFGAVVDKYGVQWMLGWELPKTN